MTLRSNQREECVNRSRNRNGSIETESEVGTKRKRSVDRESERKHKKSKTQTAVPMTTRSVRAKEVGVTRFKCDKVSDSSENVYIKIYTDGGVVKGCLCEKKFEQVKRPTCTHDSFDDKDISSKLKKSIRRVDYFNELSMELICYIFQYLTLREVLRFESLSKKLQKAVHASLSVREDIDFNEEVTDKTLFECNLPNLTNHMFTRLLNKLPRLRFMYNFHPANLLQNGSTDEDILTVLSVCDAILSCKSLEGIEISNMSLLEHLVRTSAHPKIIGKFQNRNQQFPVSSGNMMVLKDNSKITNLHLVGCSVYHLPQMDEHLEHLYLRMVKFVHHNPFKDFSASKLKTFVMSHCIGPASALKYIPLLTALADARGLKRLELQRVPFLGGVIQHICEDNWQEGGFRRLNIITMGQCKRALDADLGFLIIAAAAHLETLRIQPSLSKDAMFSALAISDITINPGFEELCLGWHEAVPFNETMSNEELIGEGLADLPESQSRLTDSGMRLVGQCFPCLKKIELRSCPHLINPLHWFTPGQHYLRQIQELTLEDCHSMRIETFGAFLTFLPELRYLTLRAIFKEPPLGCSRVGLSAGTGLGISSALINPHHVMNNQGAGNNNEDNDLNNGGVDNNGNQPAEQGQGNNEAENDGNENGVANQDEDREILANVNAGAEFENGNSRYNFRHSSRSVPHQPNSDQGPSRQSNRRDRAGSSRGGKINEKQTACGKNEFENPDSSSSGSDGMVNEREKVSDRGKALVTKKGLVSRVKSSKGKGTGSENVEESPVEKEAKSVKSTCTCVKQKSEFGCQATADDIRKTSSGRNIKRRRSSRKSWSHEKIIQPGKYKPSSIYDSPKPTPACPRHQNKQQDRPAMVDKCDSTNDPLWEEDHSKVLIIFHRRLEYLKLDAIGITALSIMCYNLHTLSISRCRVLKDIRLKEAPFLKTVHVSQCRKVNESFLLDQIYRLPANNSKFVSLRPLHYVDDSLYNDLVFFGGNKIYNFGTVMVFDYSDKPSETSYNKLRMKSWMGMLERMTTMTMMDHGWQKFNEMESPNKGVRNYDGVSCDGSKWKLFTDIPWIPMLDQCPDMEESNMKHPEWKKPGVYSMEAKGHFSFWDAYADLHDYITSVSNDRFGLYECNVLTYINMCDINGIPNKDALNIL